jgi:hypothetical protein
MDSKFVLIFLLIAGAFATEDVEAEYVEEFERAEDDEDDTEVNAEAETLDAEDDDEVYEDDEVRDIGDDEERDIEDDVEERNLKDDEAAFDPAQKHDLQKFCANPANAKDPVCNV